MVVDHKYGNTLDNRREMLRVVPYHLNGANRAFELNSAGFRGVSIKGGKYRARLQHDGKEIHLGYFKSAEAAARAYDDKARELYGEFAWTNFDELEDIPL